MLHPMLNELFKWNWNTRKKLDHSFLPRNKIKKQRHTVNPLWNCSKIRKYGLFLLTCTIILPQKNKRKSKKEGESHDKEGRKE